MIEKVENTFELETILKRNITPQEIFLGVFALDGLPTRSDLRHRNQWSLVCNCCPSTQSGHYWIAVFYDHGSIEFFYIFALAPDDRMVTFLHYTSEAYEVIISDVRLQEV